jgi:signal-transduction protein with cAMP-binding, CBS, and nucleotidyltransferase domain
MKIRELVAGEALWIEPARALREAAQQMKATGVGSLAVEVDGALEGIITERDILSAAAAGADFDRSPVSEWMTDYPDFFDPEMGVEEAATWMLSTGYRHLPVVDEGTVIGVVSIKDVLWALTEPTAV